MSPGSPVSFSVNGDYEEEDMYVSLTERYWLGG
jgi:hypothetical protein